MICPLMMLTSCRDNANSNVGANSIDALIDQEIEATNKQFPMQIDNATTLLSMSRDGNVVTYNYSIDEGVLDFDEFTAHEVSFKEQLRNNIIVASSPSTEFHAFLILLRDSDKELHYRYKGNRSGKTMAVGFSNDDIKSLIRDE